MIVKRIISNLAATGDAASARQFYADILGLEIVMDHGWIQTYAATAREMTPQLSVAVEGGSGTPVPSLSIEVDDLAEIERRLGAAGVSVEYGPVVEPWGVRRLFVRDPLGTLVNILQHL